MSEEPWPTSRTTSARAPRARVATAVVLRLVLEQAQQRLRLLPDLGEEELARARRAHEAVQSLAASPGRRGAPRPAAGRSETRSPRLGRARASVRATSLTLVAADLRRRRRRRRRRRAPRPPRPARGCRRRASSSASGRRPSTSSSGRSPRRLAALGELDRDAAERDRAVRAERHLAEVHRRRADEAGDERVHRPRRRARAARAHCCSRPSRSTATRCPSVIASDWSCVT